MRQVVCRGPGQQFIFCRVDDSCNGGTLYYHSRRAGKQHRHATRTTDSPCLPVVGGCVIHLVMLVAFAVFFRVVHQRLRRMHTDTLVKCRLRPRCLVSGRGKHWVMVISAATAEWIGPSIHLPNQSTDRLTRQPLPPLLPSAKSSRRDHQWSRQAGLPRASSSPAPSIKTFLTGSTTL